MFPLDIWNLVYLYLSEPKDFFHFTLTCHAFATIAKKNLEWTKNTVKKQLRLEEPINIPIYPFLSEKDKTRVDIDNRFVTILPNGTSHGAYRSVSHDIDHITVEEGIYENGEKIEFVKVRFSIFNNFSPLSIREWDRKFLKQNGLIVTMNFSNYSSTSIPLTTRLEEKTKEGKLIRIVGRSYSLKKEAAYLTESSHSLFDASEQMKERIIINHKQHLHDRRVIESKGERIRIKGEITCATTGFVFGEYNEERMKKEDSFPYMRILNRDKNVLAVGRCMYFGKNRHQFEGKVDFYRHSFLQIPKEGAKATAIFLNGTLQLLTGDRSVFDDYCNSKVI